MAIEFDDGKDAAAMRTIGEVSAALNIKPHVLRYWEQQFPMLKPLKRSGSRRYYRARDVAMIGEIDRLVNREGFTIKGAKKVLAQWRPVETRISEDGSKDASVFFAQSGKSIGKVGDNERELIEELKVIRISLSQALE